MGVQSLAPAVPRYAVRTAHPGPVRVRRTCRGALPRGKLPCVSVRTVSVRTASARKVGRGPVRVPRTYGTAAARRTCQHSPRRLECLVTHRAREAVARHDADGRLAQLARRAGGRGRGRLGRLCAHDGRDEAAPQPLWQGMHALLERALLRRRWHHRHRHHVHCRAPVGLEEEERGDDCARAERPEVWPHGACASTPPRAWQSSVGEEIDRDRDA